MLTGLKTGGENTTGDIVPFDDSAPGWERALYTLLAQKKWRSGRRLERREDRSGIK